jgi:hypothetical protein
MGMLLLLIAAAVPGPAFAQTSSQLTVDPLVDGLAYDGHGGLSAGASSRLLADYKPAVASEILDYLYRPKFGANLHVCKVEIGGDTQSTDGTEASHMHARDDLNCTRGYEVSASCQPLAHCCSQPALRLAALLPCSLRSSG